MEHFYFRKENVTNFIYNQTDENKLEPKLELEKDPYYWYFGVKHQTGWLQNLS